MLHPGRELSDGDQNSPFPPLLSALDLWPRQRSVRWPEEKPESLNVKNYKWECPNFISRQHFPFKADNGLPNGELYFIFLTLLPSRKLQVWALMALVNTFGILTDASGEKGKAIAEKGLIYIITTKRGLATRLAKPIHAACSNKTWTAGCWGLGGGQVTIDSVSSVFPQDRSDEPIQTRQPLSVTCLRDNTVDRLTAHNSSWAANWWHNRIWRPLRDY